MPVHKHKSQGAIEKPELCSMKTSYLNRAQAALIINKQITEHLLTVMAIIDPYKWHRAGDALTPCLLDRYPDQQTYRWVLFTGQFEFK